MASSKRVASLKQPKNLLRDEKEQERRLKDLKSKLGKIDKAIANERETLRKLQVMDADVDKAAKSKLEKKVEINRLKETMKALESDNTLSKYQKHENILLKMPPSLRQEAQEVKNPQNEQNSESEETAVSEGLEKGLKLSPDRESMMPSSQDDSLVANCDLNDDAEGKEKPQIYFDPQQLLTAEYNLSRYIQLLCETLRMDLTVKEATMRLRHMIKQDEEELTLQENEWTARIEEKKEFSEWLRKKVESHQQDGRMEALNEMVTDTYSHCGNTCPTNLSTTEKLEAVGNHMFELIDQIKEIPAGELKQLQKKTNNKWKKREQMEHQRLIEEKRHEKMEKYKKRATEKPLKTTGRKLMPRSNPDNMKAEAVSEPAEPEVKDPAFSLP